MKKFIAILVIVLSTQMSFSQNMNPEKMGEIFESITDSIQGGNGRWQFKIKETIFMCITDTNHNRMRIISPIADAKQLDEKLKSAALIANFHTALDVKYALADDVLWSVFIHPLKELTKNQVISGLSQVYSCVKTFGTTYSSGALNFPTREERDAQKN